MWCTIKNESPKIIDFFKKCNAGFLQRCLREKLQKLIAKWQTHTSKQSTPNTWSPKFKPTFLNTSLNKKLEVHGWWGYWRYLYTHWGFWTHSGKYVTNKQEFKYVTNKQEFKIFVTVSKQKASRARRNLKAIHLTQYLPVVKTACLCPSTFCDSKKKFQELALHTYYYWNGFSFSDFNYVYVSKPVVLIPLLSPRVCDTGRLFLLLRDDPEALFPGDFFFPPRFRNPGSDAWFNFFPRNKV